MQRTVFISGGLLQDKTDVEVFSDVVSSNFGSYMSGHVVWCLK
jgi:hypothetical protein